MIETKVDSVRVSLLSAHRLVILKELDRERYLPIWIDGSVADAISHHLQGLRISRPLTHDLLKNVIEELGATIEHILINDLTEGTFYARVVLDVRGRHLEIDSRPSDAIALAVRAAVPIFVSDAVMDEAAMMPSENLEQRDAEPSSDLSVFRDFVEGLDIEGPEDEH